MRTPHWIGVAVLALAVGVFVGYLAAPRETNPVDGGALPDDETHTPVDPAVPAASDRTDEPVTDSRKKSEVINPERRYRVSHARDSALIHAIRALPLPEFPIGTGIISGRIVDVDGNPISDITVQGYLPSEGDIRYPKFFDYEGRDLHEGLEEDIRNMFQQRALGNLEELRTTSDAHGKWSIHGIADGRYRIAPRDKDYEFRMPGYEFVAGDEVEIVARRLTELRIKVLTPDGNATTDLKPTITDLLENSSGHSFRAVDGVAWWQPTGDAFRLMVPPGVYMLAASGDDVSSGEPHIVEVKEAGPVEVTLQLAAIERAGIRGTIRVEGGSLLSSGRRIWYAKVPAGLSPDEVAASLTKQYLGMLDYVRDTYRIPLVDPGRYVIALGFGQKMFDWQSVDFAEGEIRADFTLVPPPPDESIVVEVSSSNWRSGSPQFRLHFDSPRPGRIGLDAWKISESEYRIIPPRDDQLDSFQPSWISVESRMGTVDLPVMHARPQRLKAIFSPQTCLLVDVGRWKAPNAHYARLSVEVQRENGSEVASAAHYNGGSTPAILNELQPGSYQLVIEYDRMVFVRESIEIHGDYVLKKVDLPRLHTLSILGLNPQTGSELTGGPYSIRKTLGYQTGSASLYLPGGEYTLKWRDPIDRQEHTRTITVSEDTTIDINQ